MKRHAFIPVGWEEDEDMWLKRPVHSTDAANLRRCSRAFIDEKAAHVYVSEVWEAELLDNAS